MSLSVIANRSHSGFRAAVYGIHFDPWGFDTLLYFVKMVAFFALMVVESLLFCLRDVTPPREGLSYIDFLSTSGIHPPPLARPFSKGLLASDYLSFTFAPLRGSILRLRRAPSLRGYPLRVISLSLSHRFGDSILRLCRGPSLRGYSLRDYLTFAFAPLRGSILRLWRAPSLRGYSLRTISLSLSHRFVDPSSAFGAPLL